MNDFNVSWLIETKVERYHSTEATHSINWSYIVSTRVIRNSDGGVSWETLVSGAASTQFDFPRYAPLGGEAPNHRYAREAHDKVVALVMG